MRDERDEADQRDERPTVPNLYPYGDAGARDPRGLPTWPVTRAEAGSRPPRSRAGDWLPLALGASLGVNVALLLGLVAVLLLARAGAFAPAPSSGSSAAAGTATSTPLSSPSPTSPLATGGLQVAPSSVQLGCDGDQRTQFVVLTNSGPRDVQWQAMFSVRADQAVVEVAPNQGNLRAGASVAIQIHSRNPSTTRQGVIHFAPADEASAGTGPSLSYTAQSCG